MIDRRRFVQHGVAGSVIALVGGIPMLAGAATSGVSRESGGLLADGVLEDGLFGDNGFKVHVAIFDRRFAAGRRFAQASETRGIPTRPIAGDVTTLWYSELYPLWKRQPVAIAGLTTYGPLFCLERLAWDHGMRLLHRQEHAARDDARDVAPNHAQGTARAGTPGEPDQILHAWIIAPRQRPPTPTWSV
jgi:hypothetical protein